MRKQKGITLIALVITIIVLLILAAVSVSMIAGDDGIVQKAAEAKEKTKASQESEKSKFDESIANIDNKLSEYVQDGTIISKGNIELEVGQVVDYDETNGGKITGLTDVEWQILGASNGKLLLVSTSNVAIKQLSGGDGYLNGIKYLDEICEQYGKGDGADTARSIRIEDVNRVTKYDVNKGSYDSNTATYNVYGYGTAYTYGKVVNGNWYHFNNEGKLINTENIELMSNYYSYFPYTLTSSDSDPKIGLTSNSPEYKLLFLNSDGTAADYWCADQFARVFDNYVNYGLRAVLEDEVQRAYLAIQESISKDVHGVRPVIVLESSVNLKKVEEKDLNGNINISWNLQ